MKASGVYLTLDDVGVITIQLRQSSTSDGKWWAIKIDGETIAAVFGKLNGSTDVIVNNEPEML